MSAFTRADIRVTIGRYLDLTVDGHPMNGEILIVAVLIGSEESIAAVVDADRIVGEAANELLTSVPHARPLGPSRLRGGWRPAVLQDVWVPRGEGTRRGFKFAR